MPIKFFGRQLLLAVLIVSLLLPCLPATALAAGNTIYRALIIGNSDYDRYGGVSLGNAPYNDADIMHSVLNAASFTRPEMISKQRDLSKAQIIAQIGALASAAKADDVTYFFYSGHGAMYNGVAYLCAMGTSTIENWLSMSELESELSKIQGTKVVILDSCYSGGAISKSLVSKPQDSLKAYDAAVVSAFSQSSSALARSAMTKGGYKVIASSSQYELSWNTDSNNSGRFTESLGIGAGIRASYASRIVSTSSGSYSADFDGNGAITLPEIYTWVNNHASQYSASSHCQVYPQQDSFPIFQYSGANNASILSLSAQPYSGNISNAYPITFKVNMQKSAAITLYVAQNNGYNSTYKPVKTMNAKIGENTFAWNGRINGTVAPAGNYLFKAQLSSGGDDELPPQEFVLVKNPIKPIISMNLSDTFMISGAEKELKIDLTDLSNVHLAYTVQVLDQSSQVVRTLAYNDKGIMMLNKNVPGKGDFVALVNSYYWNGCNDSGAQLPAGLYKVRAIAYNGGVASDPKEAFVALHSSDGTTPMVTSFAPVSSTFTNGSGREAVFRFSATVPATVSITILNSNGSTVATVVSGAQYTSGTAQYYWNGIGTNGASIATGTYSAKVVAQLQGASQVTLTTNIDVKTSGKPYALTSIRVPSSLVPGSKFSYSFRTTAYCIVTPTILDATGKEVTKLPAIKAKSGRNYASWDGKVNGKYLPQGTYKLRLIATSSNLLSSEPAYASYSQKPVIVPKLKSLTVTKTPVRAGSSAKLTVGSETPALARIYLYNSKKEYIRVAYSALSIKTGSSSVYIAAKNGSKKLAAGTYYIGVMLTASGGSTEETFISFQVK